MIHAAASAATDTMRRHVNAVTCMILGRSRMAPGLAIAAGQLLDNEEITQIADLAYERRTDVIYLDFAIDRGIATLCEIILAMPRRESVHIRGGCQLAQRPEHRRHICD